MKEDAGLVFSCLIAALKEIPCEILAGARTVWRTLWLSQAQAAEQPMQFAGVETHCKNFRRPATEGGTTAISAAISQE